MVSFPTIETDELQNDAWMNGERKHYVIEQTINSEYAAYRADCVSVCRALPDNSVHFSIWSPPFLGMYQFSDAIEDMSNVTDDTQLLTSLDYLIAELARCMMPSRIVAFHCMNIPATIEHDGYIGIKDFRGDLIRAFQRHGFIYHSEVMIWKDPLVAATRTHALGLAHQQAVKDSAMCRQGIADYLVMMRKPGVNPEPVTHKPSGFARYIGDPKREPKQRKREDPKVNKYSHEVWQNYASMAWFDINPSDTLQRISARDADDSKHIAPLQLTVIRRAIELWTNPGDIVLSCFGGIGSEGYVALQEGRRAVLCELKDTYYRQMVRNLDAAIESRTHGMLFQEAECVNE